MPQTHSGSIRLASLLLTLGCAPFIACGGTTVDPTQQTAQVQLTASPSTINPSICPTERCGSATGQVEALTTVTVRETGGVAGRVDSIRMTLRRTADNALITEGVFTPAAPTRFPANGTVTLPVAVHYDVAQGAATATLTLSLAATDDNNHSVSATGYCPGHCVCTPGHSPRRRHVSNSAAHR